MHTLAGLDHVLEEDTPEEDVRVLADSSPLADESYAGRSFQGDRSDAGDAAEVEAESHKNLRNRESQVDHHWLPADRRAAGLVAAAEAAHHVLVGDASAVDAADNGPYAPELDTGQKDVVGVADVAGVVGVVGVAGVAGIGDAADVEDTEDAGHTEAAADSAQYAAALDIDPKGVGVVEGVEGTDQAVAVADTDHWHALDSDLNRAPAPVPLDTECFADSLQD